MEKQYQDLITKLIKEHAKYTGHESILDELVQDVYTHARVVITSVTNEDVIVSYLNKVISNSIITVSKKNNLNIRPKHTIDSVLSAVNATRIETNKSNKKTEIETISNEELVEEVVEELVELESEPVEEVVEELVELESEPVEEIKPDMALVDKMINGITNEPKEQDEEEAFDVSDIDNVVVLSEEENEDELLEPEITEELVEEDNVVSFAQEVAVNAAIDDFLSEKTDNMPEAELIEEEIVDVISEEEDLLIEETIENEGSVELFEEVNDEIIDLDETSSLEEFDTNAELIEEEEEDDEKVEEQPPASNSIYNFFNYEPSLEEPFYSSEEIVTILKEYDKKHPEYKIMTIAELKYIKNASVEEIATTLNMTKDKVLETLNEIIDLVKD